MAAPSATLPQREQVLVPKTPLPKTIAGQPPGHSAGKSISGGSTIVSRGADRPSPSKKWADLVEAEQELQQFDGNVSDGYLPCATGNSNCCHCAQRPRDQTSSEDEEQLDIILRSSPPPHICNPNRFSRPGLSAASANYNPYSTSGAVASPVTPCSFSSSNNPTASPTTYFYNSSSPSGAVGAVASPCTPCSFNQPFQNGAMPATPTSYHTQLSPQCATVSSSASFHSVSPLSATAASREVKVSPQYCRKSPTPICFYTPPYEDPGHNLGEWLPPALVQEQAVFAGYKTPLSTRKLEYHDQSNYTSKQPDTARSSKPVGTSTDQGQQRSGAILGHGAPEKIDKYKQLEHPIEREGVASTDDGESISMVGDVQPEKAGRKIRRWNKKTQNLQSASQPEVGAKELQPPSVLSETPATPPAVQECTIVPIEWPLSAYPSVKRKNRNWWPSNLRHFMGGKSTRLHDEAELWLKTLGSSVLIHQWDFPTAFRVIRSTLSGAPLTWYEANKKQFIEHQEGLAAGWLEFWTGFEANFVVKDAKVLGEELENRVQIQGESVEDYAASVKELARRLRYDVDDAIVRFQLIKGILDPVTRANLETLLPSSFQGILQKVDDYQAYDSFVKKKTPTLSQSADQGRVDVTDVRQGPAEKQGPAQAELGDDATCKNVTRISNRSGQVTPLAPPQPQQVLKKPAENQASLIDNKKNTLLTDKQTKTARTSSQGGDSLPEKNKAPQPESSLPEKIRAIIPKPSTVLQQEAVPPAQESLTDAPIKPVQESLVSKWQVRQQQGRLKGNMKRTWSPKVQSHKTNGSTK